MPIIYWIINFLAVSGFFNDGEYEIEKEEHSDYFYYQRAFPFDTIPQSFYQKSIQEVKLISKSASRHTLQSWRFAGPSNIGGRVTDIEGMSSNPNVFYIGSASGGVFKTSDQGKTWSAIFDQQSNLSIGDMAIFPNDSNSLLVGTGEANGGGGSVTYDGNGIFLTNDGGKSWKPMGLENSGSIPKIIVHPGNQNIIYVAAMGRLFSKNNQRGIFKSIDGGKTWNQLYFHSDSVGVIDMVMDFQHPDTIYAATWQRSRKPSGIDYGGAECGIIRSRDGGKSWHKLTNGLPKGNDLGRIGLALAPSDTKTLYALYVDATGDYLGTFRSTNSGDTWISRNGRVNSSTFGWWFGKIYVDPKDANIVYGLGFNLSRSVDGGNQFIPITENIGEDVHVDDHALYINPNNPTDIWLGNDGGLYHTMNSGNNWTFIPGLPITQFYTCHIDNKNPSRIYGGTQDNSPMRVLDDLKPDQWQVIWGGDGFVTLVDPTDNSYIYTESQYGGLVRSTDGGANFYYATQGINQDDRRNWNMPFALNPRNPVILYLGTDKIYKSVNRAETWDPISLSLTEQTHIRAYGTITTISISPIDPNIIYCGTDVGNVWRTTDGGKFWNQIDQDLPDRYITSITADPISKDKVYCTISGFRFNEPMPHVYLSYNNGFGWKEISGGLPSVPVNKLIVDPTTSGHLVIATDAGVWRTRNEGLEWELLGKDLPSVVCTDLSFHPGTRKLAVATYGRGVYTYDLELSVKTKDQILHPMALTVFPNPVQDKINLMIEANQSSDDSFFEIYNESGQKLFSQKVKLTANFKNNLVLNPALDQGVYILSVRMNGSTIGSKKFIKL